jgi:hypothetical protein
MLDLDPRRCLRAFSVALVAVLTLMARLVYAVAQLVLA